MSDLSYQSRMILEIEFEPGDGQHLHDLAEGAMMTRESLVLADPGEPAERYSVRVLALGGRSPDGEVVLFTAPS